MASYRGMTLYSNHLCRMLSTSKFTANNSVILVSRGCVSFNGVIHRNFSINGNRILLQKLKPNEKSSLTESKSDGGLQTSFTKKAKENVKTASYGMVIVAGVGVTGIILYTIFQELFSGDSPNSLFQMASEKCIAHPKVQDMLGEPIKAFGEENRRGRRRHVSSMNYVDEEGRKGIRVQFYLQGLRKKATAQIDAREDQSGHMKTRFIIVTAEDLFHTSVVVEDNR